MDSGLVVDEALAGVRADDDARDAHAVALGVDLRRHHVVVEAAPVIPGQEDRGGVPVRAVHDRVDDPGHVGLARADQGRRVLAVGGLGHDPRHLRQRARLGLGVVAGQRLDVASPGGPACTSVKPGSVFQIFGTPDACCRAAGRRGPGSSPSSRRTGAAARSGRSRRTAAGWPRSGSGAGRCPCSSSGWPGWCSWPTRPRRCTCAWAGSTSGPTRTCGRRARSPWRRSSSSGCRTAT